ncbi:peptidase family M48-domain-containing protein [Scenedesmus sp. NREL 46B-D3]|nr:peptidase family M48-domain-containing protein [Scenedesmus sp. NREL 46B-D3]
MSGLVRPVDGTSLRLTGHAACSSSSRLQQQVPPQLLRHLSRQVRRDWLQRAHAVQPSQSLHSTAENGKEQRIKRYAGLTADDFRHPLDQQNTSLIQALPGMDFIARTLMGPVAEQVLLLENIATSIKTGPDQLPTVYNLLLEAAEVLQMEPPELYVRQSPHPNAYTLAITGRKPFIVVHTSLLELLTLPELQAVIAHELGHLKCDHGLWLTIANVLASGTVSILPLISGTVEDALLRWLRAAELTCDRAALLVAQDPAVVIGALMKLAGGSPAFAHELSVDAFLQQARSYDEVTTSSMLGWYLRNAQNRALSHPLPVMRAREIDRWAQGAQYKGLMARNRLTSIPITNGSSSNGGSSGVVAGNGAAAAGSAGSASTAAGAGR